MKKKMAAWTGGLAALAFSGLLEAHHSGYMYQTTPMWVMGTVISFEGIDPHTITTVEERSADGQVRRWAVEGPGQTQLDLMGISDVPRIGDAIEFCAFPYKSPAELSRMFPGLGASNPSRPATVDGSAPQRVAGHVMARSNGEMQLWEANGVIGECIRSSDFQRQSWLDFVNSDSRVRQSWCAQTGYTPVLENASLREFVQEVNSSIDNPCR